MKRLFRLISEDIQNHGGRSFVGVMITICFNMSFRLLLNYRLGNYFVARRNWVVNVIILWLKKNQLQKYNSDISYHCTIGRKISFPHPLGIVIGEKTIINDNVSIWQHATFGSHGKFGEEMSYPTIQKNVKIYSHALIIGGVNIGENSIVAAKALVTKDVPANSIAIGIPATYKPRNL